MTNLNKLKALTVLSLIEELTAYRECLEFYADPENWIKRYTNHWVAKGGPHLDDEMILDYKHPGTDWVGTITVSGKRAREVLKKFGGSDDKEL
jgi:hypothetical protein